MARYTTDAEVSLLARYAKNSKIGIVEIGVLDGETTREFSSDVNVPIYGIDPIIPDSMNLNLVGSADLIRNNMSHYNNFTLYEDYSFNVIKEFTNKFDFIFIDGDHEYDSVRKDFDDWSNKLEIGGYVAFHDSGSVTSIEADFKGWPGCIQIVDEIKSGKHGDSFEWIENVDTINIFKKLK
jgi:hypothetical protein